MAKKQSTNKNDPATLAFSAVENALKGSILSADAEHSSASKAPEGNSSKPFSSKTPERNNAASRIARKTGSVANDDNLAPSKLLYGLNAKASSLPIWIASVLSAIWLAVTGLATWSRFDQQLTEGQTLGNLAGTLDFAGIVAVMFLPVLGFFAVAILARRAQDLRIAANSMTRAAISLAEPETTAADKIATVGQAVRREVSTLADGLERALSRAGELEVMIHNEVTVLDKTYSENESRMRGLIQELASQRDSVITNSERVREAISESHSGLVFDLDMIAQRIAGTIEERGGELTRSMNEASENLTKAFGERSDSFISLVDGRTTGLLSALDDSAGKLNLALEDRTSSISSAFEERTHELASVIDMRMNAITEALDTRAVTLNEAIEERTASISSVLRDGGGKILSDLRDRGHEVGGALDAIGLRVANEISGRASEAEATMTQLIDQMDEMVSTQINAMESRMQSAMLEISGSVDETSEQARQSLLGAGAQTLAQFDTRVEEVAVVIDTRLKSFDDVISEKGERLTAALDSYTNSFASRANVLELALDEKTGHFNDQISQRTREMAETITGRANLITDTIESRTKQIADSLESGNSNIAGTLDARRLELEATLDGTAESIAAAMGARTEEVAAAIDAHTGTVSEMISAKVSEVTHNLNTGIESAISRIDDAETGISARVEQAASTVNKSAALTADLIEAGVNSARTAITDMVDERLGTLPEAITARADIAADRLAALNESISTTMGKTMTELETSATNIEETINNRIVTAATNLSADIEQNAGRMDTAVRVAMEKITEVAGRFETLISIDAAQSATALGEQVEHINRTITEKTGEFAALVSEKSNELSSSLHNHGNILNEALQANAHEAQNIMSNTTSRMMTDVTGALEKLNESNALLQQVLEASTNNLATLENSVSSQTATYSATVREALGTTEQAGQLVSDHVGALQITIRSMIEEFGSMVGKLDGETASIDRAAQNLAHASDASMDAVEARREAMDALAAGFTARADDIDNRLRTFAQSIADTVADTEQRLLVARTAMDEALSSTTDMVTEKLQGLAEMAGAEGQRTSAALGQTQEAMLAEMQQALADATRRFNETAQSMQDTARQVGSELESTRSELQRGFLELPEETRASAAAMRSVVAEQIEALSELNAIVHAQPASHDVSQASITPPPRTPRPATPPTPAVAPVAPPTPTQHRQPPPPPPPPAPTPAPALHTPSTRSESVLDTLTRPALAPAPSPAAPAPATPRPAVATPPPKEGSGWLRDVLRNASANQQAGSGAQAPRTTMLSSLTDDIARSIDENALAEAWQRYQAGETGVFSRRIYTLTGQGTYDDVRKKLQRDPDFAQTARDYVAEFEQFMQSARDAGEARQMLVSDRGKVFTMLAHASGRIN